MEKWEGFCDYLSTETEFPGYIFQSIQNSKQSCYIRAYDALPSYCRFLKYTLHLKYNNITKQHDVKEIFSVQPLPIFSVDFLVHISRNLTKKTSSVEFSFTKLGKTLPHEIISFDVLPKEVSAVKYLLQDCFHPSIFYDLLPYFSSSFLRLLNDSELKLFHDEFLKRKEIFFFWEVMFPYLKRKGIRECILNMDAREIFHKDRLVLKFSQTRPLLSLVLAPDSLRSAILLSMNLWKQYVYYGHRLHPLPKKFSDEDIEVLKKIGSVSPMSSRLRGITFSYHYDDEILCLPFLEKTKIICFHCRSWTSEFVVKIQDYVSKGFQIFYPTQPIEKFFVRCLILHNNSHESNINSHQNDNHIVIVQASRFTLQQLQNIITTRPNLEELILIGDLYENGPNYHRGGGNIFQVLSKQFSYEVLNFPCHCESIYKQIQNGTMTGVVATENTIDDIITSVWIKECKTKIAVCSDYNHLRMLSQFNRNFAQYNDSDVKLNDTIHILNEDIIGKLTSATQTYTLRQLTKTDTLQSYINYNIVVDIGDGNVDKWEGNTQHLSIQRMGLVIASQFIGPLYENIIIFVSSYTTLTELLSVIKYATEKVIIIWLENTTIASLSKQKKESRMTLTTMLKQKKRKRKNI